MSANIFHFATVSVFIIIAPGVVGINRDNVGFSPQFVGTVLGSLMLLLLIMLLFASPVLLGGMFLYFVIRRLLFSMQGRRIPISDLVVRKNFQVIVHDSTRQKNQ